jgi:hypothetical protein
MAMTSRPPVPDSLPTPALEAEAAGASSISPSEADDRQSVERVQPDVGPQAGQWWRHISDEEWRARHEEYKRRLAEIDAEDDTPEEVYDEVMRNIEALDSCAGEASERPSSTTGPPKAGESQSLPWPYRDVDPWTGRLRPISDEELQARYEQLRRELAEIDAADDTPDEVYDQFMRNIDEERRRQGRPPAFEGYY